MQESDIDPKDPMEEQDTTDDEDTLEESQGEVAQEDPETQE